MHKRSTPVPIHRNSLLGNPSIPRSSKCSLFLRSTHESPFYISFLIRATRPIHRILLDLITWLILGKGYRSQKPSLCHLLQSHATSSLLDPNIFLGTLFSKSLILYVSLYVGDQAYTHNKQQVCFL